MASPLLAPSTFPFVLDKLGAPQVETKVECLQLIQKMISDPPGPFSKIIEPHLPPLMHALINEYFNQYEDNALQKETAKTIAIVIKKVKEEEGVGITKSH